MLELRNMKAFFQFIWEIFKVVIIALLIVIPIRYFIFQPFFVRGDSMMPNFENSDYLLIDQISYRFNDPKRGEVVVFRYPENPSFRYIKRIIGLPGETVQIGNGNVTILDNNEVQILDESDYLPSSLLTPGEGIWVLLEDEYFVLGDNRLASADSRRWGPLSRDEIIGRVFFKAWPFSDFSKIKAPAY